MGAYVYILRCCDGRYFVGTTRTTLGTCVAEHNAGTFGGFTKSRRPVVLVYSEQFERSADADAAERQLKGWSRKKKEALISGDLDRLEVPAKNRTGVPRPSTGSG